MSSSYYYHGTRHAMLEQEYYLLLGHLEVGEIVIANIRIVSRRTDFAFLGLMQFGISGCTVPQPESPYD
jgi:hypothetical protein